jgi:tRNA A37 threonylcarbamoyladenosine dehydratase
LGGVGSWTAEALARSGIGQLTLIDMDDVCVTNTNRQLHALSETFGRPKAEVLAERIRLIAPTCRVAAEVEYITPTNAARLLDRPFDYVVDAVDRMSIKALILSHAVRNRSPAITAGAAGGKRDGTAVRVADLGFSGRDMLLKQVRKKLRRSHGFPHAVAGRAMAMGIAAVFSEEPPVFPHADGTCHLDPEPGTSLALDCFTGFGSATFVTGTFGFALAGEVVRFLAHPTKSTPDAA